MDIPQRRHDYGHYRGTVPDVRQDYGPEVLGAHYYHDSGKRNQLPHGNPVGPNDLIKRPSHGCPNRFRIRGQDLGQTGPLTPRPSYSPSYQQSLYNPGLFTENDLPNNSTRVLSAFSPHRSIGPNELPAYERVCGRRINSGNLGTIHTSNDAASPNSPWPPFSHVSYGPGRNNGQHRYPSHMSCISPSAGRSYTQGTYWPSNASNSLEATRNSKAHVQSLFDDQNFVPHGSRYSTQPVESRDLPTNLDGNTNKKSLHSPVVVGTAGLHPSWKSGGHPDSYPAMVQQVGPASLSGNSLEPEVHCSFARVGRNSTIFSDPSDTTGEFTRTLDGSKSHNRIQSYEASPRPKHRESSSRVVAKQTESAKHHRRSFTAQEKAKISQMRKVGACSGCRRAKRKVYPVMIAGCVLESSCMVVVLACAPSSRSGQVILAQRLPRFSGYRASGSFIRRFPKT